MRFLSACLIFFVASLAAALAQTPPVIRAMAVTPEPSNRLASGQALYVRVAYSSGQPLRFQAAGYFQGLKHGHLLLNASPVYPAGQGEAVVWLAGEPGARLDEIRVGAHDQAWTPLAETAVPVNAE